MNVTAFAFFAALLATATGSSLRGNDRKLWNRETCDPRVDPGLMNWCGQASHQCAIKVYDDKCGGCMCYDETGGGGSWCNPDKAVPDPNGKNGWKANSGCQTKAKKGEDCTQSFMCEGDLKCDTRLNAVGFCRVMYSM